MAHAAPATGTSGLRKVSAGTALPVVLGIVYGFWTSGIERDAHGEEVTAGNVLFGFLMGALFAIVWYALHRMAPRLPREQRALAWTAFGGISFGYLYSLTGASILRSVLMSLAIAAGVFAVTFYRYYTTED